MVDHGAGKHPGHLKWTKLKNVMLTLGRLN